MCLGKKKKTAVERILLQRKAFVWIKLALNVKDVKFLQWKLGSGDSISEDDMKDLRKS